MENSLRSVIDALASKTSIEFYNLMERPFGLVPNSRFVYHSLPFTAALTQLVQALDRRERFIVITGNVGVGKTLTSQILLHDLPAGTLVSRILDPFLDLDDFLNQVLSDFGANSSAAGDHDPTDDTRQGELIGTLRRFLASVSPERRAVIMIDEAQNLDADVLAQIHVLMSFEACPGHPQPGRSSLQLILFGQPELETLLRSSSLRRLNQDVSCRCQLRPLAPVEVRPYIERRLKVAGGERDDETGSCPVQFTDAAVRIVGRLSQGVPRAINSLCDRSLEVGCERRERTIGWETVFAAVGRTPIPLPFMRELSPVHALRGVMARLMLIVVVMTSWRPARRYPSNRRDYEHPLKQGDTMTLIETTAFDIRFRTRPLGFDKGEVHALLTKLLEQHRQDRAEIDALTRQLNQVQGKSTAEPTLQQNEVLTLERILASAHRVADEIRTEAQRAAAGLLSAAHDKATRLLTDGAAAAQEQANGAADQLKSLELEIELMRRCHGEVRATLEAAVTAVGATLADISALSTTDPTEATPPEITDLLNRVAQENERKAQV
jgi:general secretion pathway protein A